MAFLFQAMLPAKAQEQAALQEHYEGVFLKKCAKFGFAPNLLPVDTGKKKVLEAPQDFQKMITAPEQGKKYTFIVRGGLFNEGAAKAAVEGALNEMLKEQRDSLKDKSGVPAYHALSVSFSREANGDAVFVVELSRLPRFKNVEHRTGY